MNILIIIPCYNEEEVLPQSHPALLEVANRLVADHKADSAGLLYVDDGSRDETWPFIEAQSLRNPNVHGLKLAHNVGHQNAIWAGMEWAANRADAVVTIDADLQDDVASIANMVDLFRDGHDVVFGVRRERTTDTWFKRTTAQGFYRLMHTMGTGVVYNHADFRLLSRRALQSLTAYPERNLFIRGMVSQMGYPCASVYYDRKERQAGESKYPLRRMLAFALDGITSFSVRPLQLITWIGLFCMLIALLAIVYGLVAYFSGHAITGWTSLIVSLWFLGGAILLACGIIGEYVGKIYTEVKRRPRYFVEKEV